MQEDESVLNIIETIIRQYAPMIHL